MRGFKTQNPEYTPDPRYKPGSRGQRGGESQFYWAGGACLALLDIPTPRLRYVVVRARSTPERGEVGGLFVYEDAVTAQDLDDASEFDGEMVAQVDHREPTALDRRPLTLPPPEIPALGPDDFVVYARHGERDPTGRNWAWDEPVSSSYGSTAQLRIVVFIALRGLVTSDLVNVMVCGAPGRAELLVGYAEEPHPNHSTWTRELQARIDSLVPGLHTEFSVQGHVERDHNRGPTSGDHWLPALQVGPPPWAIGTDDSD